MKNKRRAILVTGFEPFGGDAINPSWQIAQALERRRIAGHRVHALELPVTFGDANAVLADAIDRLDPAVTIALGQAGGRAAISLERIAINVIDARIPDNAGRQPVDVPVCADGPAAYFSTLPIKAIRAALQSAGIPAEISQTAGTFVCNDVFYGLMHAAASRPGMRAGFVHVPYLPQQAAQQREAASMALQTMIEAVRIAIETAVVSPDDVAIAGGATH